MVSQTPAEARLTSGLSDMSDARLRALTEHALEIITVQSADGTFIYSNEAVVRYLGYSVSELLGHNAAEFLHPDDAEAMRERFRGLLSNRDAPPELNRFEYRFRHRDGSWIWLESVAVNALDNPTVLGIIAHSRDINRRKANERILSLNHARYRTVADLSEGAVHEYLMNAQGVYELEWTLGADRAAPVGLTDVTITFRFDSDADDGTADRLVELAERYCVVAQTLMSPPSITVRRAAPAG